MSSKHPVSILMNGITSYKPWVKYWVIWLIVLHMASLLFFPNFRAIVVLTLFLLNCAWMTLIAYEDGFSKKLALPHLIFYTATIIFLMLTKDIGPESLFMRYWIYTLILFQGISLIIDVHDLHHYYSHKERKKY